MGRAAGQAIVGVDEPSVLTNNAEKCGCSEVDSLPARKNGLTDLTELV